MRSTGRSWTVVTWSFGSSVNSGSLLVVWPMETSYLARNPVVSATMVTD